MERIKYLNILNKSNNLNLRADRNNDSANLFDDRNDDFENPKEI